METSTDIAQTIKKLQELQNATTRTLEDQIWWEENKHYLESPNKAETAES